MAVCAISRAAAENGVEEVKVGGASPAAEAESPDAEILRRLAAAVFEAYVDRETDTLYLSGARSHEIYGYVDIPDVEAAYRVPLDSDDEPTIKYRAFPLHDTSLLVLAAGLDVMVSREWLSNDDRDYIMGVVDERIGDEISDLPSLYIRLKCLQISKAQFGTHLDGRLIPLQVHVNKVKTRSGLCVYAHGECTVCDRKYVWYGEADETFFREDGVHSRKLTADQALEKLGLRILTAEQQAELDRRVARANALNRTPGRVMDVTGNVLVVQRMLFGQRLTPMTFGSVWAPVACVTENELESERKQDRFWEARAQPSGAPYVRLFDFKRREYVYADVDDLAPYAFDAAALDKLEVDDDYRDLLRRVFTAAERPAQIGDLIRGKNGGVIILASGPSGTGKTMTAECLGEITGRPIYSIGLADLGSSLDKVSANLDAIIARAERWNALLLIDEADVILAARGDDLTRSAIVGLFLHRIEYFRGYLFLTSNLPETLDAAVMSRVTLHRRYPAHTPQTRAKVWRRLLAHAGLVAADETIAALAERRIDGRNVRSVVKLARMLNPAGSELSLPDLERILEFSAVESAA